MCRLLGYFGAPIQLGQILAEPKHSLIVQSYQPQEMTAGLLNADGFGIGWYHADRQATTEPFRYRNTLPIWSDVNLPHLNRYVESGCIVANVRSATPGLAVDLANCQPFCFGQITAIHNGYIENFRQSLYRQIRDHLDDEFYTSIDGHTDSEHIFALLLNNLKRVEFDLTVAIEKTLIQSISLGKAKWRQRFIEYGGYRW
jgi:ergothioneine biosynthesis protein EgtC